MGTETSACPTGATVGPEQALRAPSSALTCRTRARVPQRSPRRWGPTTRAHLDGGFDSAEERDEIAPGARMAGGVVGEPPVRHDGLRVVLAHRLGYAERCVIVAGDQAADLSGKTAGPLVLAAITGDTG